MSTTTGPKPPTEQVVRKEQRPPTLYSLPEDDMKTICRALLAAMEHVHDMVEADSRRPEQDKTRRDRAAEAATRADYETIRAALQKIPGGAFP